MAKRPKTTGLLQGVFAAGGDMALVGIRRTINATLSPFKSFRQITPSHRRHIPVRRERRIKGGTVFCAHPIGRSPQIPANPDFLLPFIRVTCYNGIDCVKKSLNLQKVRKE